MKKVLLGAILAGLAISAEAETPPVLVWCDGCSDAQMQQTAKSAIGSGTVYVGNINSRTVQAYSVYSESETNLKAGGTGDSLLVKQADPIPGTAPYQATAEALVTYYYAAPVGWGKAFTATTDGKVRSMDGVQRASGVSYPVPGVNVYDVVLPGAEQNDLTNWVEGLTSSSLNSIPANIESMASTFKLIDAGHMPTVQFRINFDDGSHIDIKEDFSTADAKASVVDDSGRDSHNNNVPSSKDSAVGGRHGASTYRFSGPGNSTDHQNWLDHMNLWDIPVTTSGTGNNYKCGSYTDDKGVHVFCVSAF